MALEDDRAARREDVAGGADELAGLPGVDRRQARLPVAHLGLEAAELGVEDVRRVRDDELERAREAREERPADELDREAESLGVLARERERVGRDVGAR